MVIKPEWLPGSLLAGLDWRIPAALSSLPRSSGTRLKIGDRRSFYSCYCGINVWINLFCFHRNGKLRVLECSRRLLPMASCGKVHPSFSAMWASSFNLACCFLPSSLIIFSLNHWYGCRSSKTISIGIITQNQAEITWTRCCFIVGIVLVGWEWKDWNI